MEIYRLSKYFVLGSATAVVLVLASLLFTSSLWVNVLLALLMISLIASGIWIMLKGWGIPLFPGVLTMVIVLFLPLLYLAVFIGMDIHAHPYWWSDDPSKCENVLLQTPDCYTQFALRSHDPEICNNYFGNLGDTVEGCVAAVDAAS